ncbi:TetR family transcriptional regulator [Nocardia neocaledoniensis NBRC 108232]|uniref:TetR family transcriptional regulator n=1 Tax=Nocardia neocaledoniensis TaxID=236511 RepID=A0A317NNS6_9NOCA|nr:TetR/AcrR family transcriptional regulator [Nocardia neocaledoniensis]PWV76453.1 TetR family transcriptional regulator [Nocardia neocaledoniensis]GEM29420.1 TetR family transcriptional regulator [Nocardia neocaledoniensis NBRC 108232]
MPEDKPLRSDAKRNRDALVTAARELFEERGLDAPLKDIAARAGVAIGTLYNRFPTRDELIAAAVDDRVGAGTRIAEEALEIDDPWESFVHLVEGICALQANDRILGDLALRAPPSPALERARAHGHELMRRIIARAQQAGALRADWTLEDIAFITWSHTSVLTATASVAPDLWRRNLALILDGLRAKAAHPLPVPALTEDQLMQVMRG